MFLLLEFNDCLLILVSDALLEILLRLLLDLLLLWIVDDFFLDNLPIELIGRVLLLILLVL